MEDRINVIEKIKEDVREKGFSYIDKDVLSRCGNIKTLVKELNEEADVVAGKIKYAIENDESAVYFVYDEKHFEPKRVVSVVDYLHHVLKYEDENVNRYFRGQKAHYDLRPSLFRDNGKYVEKEMELNAKVYNDRPQDFIDCHSTFEKLVRLKHYVHASRLIDISSSPLVALYFACKSSSEDKDVGVVLEVYCEKEKEKYSVSSDTVVMLTAMTNTVLNLPDGDGRNSLGLPCIEDEIRLKVNGPIRPKACGDSCYYKCWPNKVLKKSESDEGRKLKDEIFGKNTWASTYIGELSHQCKKEGMVIYWDDLCFNELNQCILVRPPLNNDRIVRQQGSFIMCGMNPEDIYKPPESLYEFFKYPDLSEERQEGDDDNSSVMPVYKKATFYYILPEDKEFILGELKVFGMDNYYFFPELENEIAVVKASVDKINEDGIKTEERKNWKERKKKALIECCPQTTVCPCNMRSKE